VYPTQKRDRGTERQIIKRRAYHATDRLMARVERSPKIHATWPSSGLRNLSLFLTKIEGGPAPNRSRTVLYLHHHQTTKEREGAVRQHVAQPMGDFSQNVRGERTEKIGPEMMTKVLDLLWV